MWEGPVVYKPDLQNNQQTTTFKYGVCKDLKDPEFLGRARFELTSDLDEGEENWTDWTDITGMPSGGTEQRTASGIWWPPQPGDLHLITFKDTDWLTPVAIPGLSWKETPDQG